MKPGNVAAALVLIAACQGPDSKDSAAPSTGASPTTLSSSGPTTGSPVGPTTPTNPVPATFTAHRIGSPVGPAYVTVADLDEDGQPELLVSRFDKPGLAGVPGGAVTRWVRTGDVTQWSQEDIVPPADDVEFPNHVTPHDVDHDGDLDVIVPSGFLVCEAVPWEGACGALSWYEQTPTGWEPHVLFENAPLFYHHVELADLNGDGTDDLVTVGERINAFGADEAVAVWIPGTAGGFGPAVTEIGQGLGSFPRLRDLDGDGDLDAASAEYAVAGGSFAWYEQEALDSWTRHVIADDVGPSIQLSFVDDLYGDGVTRAVGANHTNTAQANPDPWESAVFAFEVPGDPTQPWPKAQLSQGIVSVPGSIAAPMAAPGIFGHGDIDGDGDIDLVVAGDGDPRVMWMEQLGPDAFAMHVLHPDLPQAGGMVVADLDGDGRNEVVVTGYEDDALFVVTRDP